jgi:hypothetical protein
MASDEVMISILQCHPVDLSASGRRRDGVDQHFVSLRCMAVGVPAKPGPVQHTEVLFAGDMICVWDLEMTSKWPAFADPLDVCFRFLKVVVRGGRLDLEALPAATHFDSFVRPLGGKVPRESTEVHGLELKDVEGAQGVVQVTARMMAAISAAAVESRWRRGGRGRRSWRPGRPGRKL